MLSTAWLSCLALLALTIPVVRGQRNTCAVDEDGRQGAQCIKGQGREFASAFCSSFLPITTPIRTSTTTVTDTVTRNVTSFVGTRTETFSPPVTTTLSQTETYSSTVTETSYNTVTSGTITDFIETVTTDVTSFSNVFTCPGDPASTSSAAITSSSTSSLRTSSQAISPTLSFSTTSKNVTTGGGGSPTGTISHGTSGHGTGTTGTAISSFAYSGSLPYYSGSLPYYTWTRSTQTPSTSSPSSSSPPTTSSDPATSSSSLPPTIPPYITAPAHGGYGKEKRQVFGRPRCLRRLDRTSGLAGISDACNCLDIATPAPSTSISTVIDPDTTSTVTNIIRTVSTSITNPTITATQSVNRTLILTDFVTSQTTVPATVSGTLTHTVTSISSITGPSPTPSTFNIYYTLNSTQPANFFQAGPAPGGSGIVIANERQADFFSIDGVSRLVDVTAGNLFMAKNTEDYYPFALLQTTAAAGNTPVCQACGGRLTCGFPRLGGGVGDDVFAICYGVLALGPREVFGRDADEDGEPDCRIIDLLFK